MGYAKDLRIVVPGVDILFFDIPRFCRWGWRGETQTVFVSVHEAWWPALVARIAWIHRARRHHEPLPAYREPPNALRGKSHSFGYGGVLTVTPCRFSSRVLVTLPYRPGMGIESAYSMAEVVHAISFSSLPVGHGRTRDECRDVPVGQSQMVALGSMVVVPSWKSGGYRLDVRLSPAARYELRSLFNTRDVQELQDTVKKAMLSATARISKKSIRRIPEKCDCVVDQENGRIRLARLPDFQHTSTEETFGERLPGLRLTGIGENTVSGQFATLAGVAALDHWLVQNATVR